MNKPLEQQQARNLFFQTDLKQTEIARILNINSKTLYLWIKQGSWDQIKAAARHTPAALVESYYEQLLEINEAIARREFGARYPTPQEAETIRKLTITISKIKQQVSLSENIQVMTNFTTYLHKIDPELSKQVVQYADEYIKGRVIKGFHPYDVAYDAPEPFEENTPTPEPVTGQQSAIEEPTPAPQPLPIEAKETSPTPQLPPPGPGKKPGADQAQTGKGTGISYDKFWYEPRRSKHHW